MQCSGSTPLFSKTLARREGHYPSADDSNPDSFRPNGLPRGTSLRLNNWAHLQFSNGWSFVDLTFTPYQSLVCHGFIQPASSNSWWHHLKCKSRPSLSLGLALASLHPSYFCSMSPQLVSSFCVLAIHQALTNFCPTIWHLGDGWCQRLPLPVPPPVSMLVNASLFFFPLE